MMFKIYPQKEKNVKNFIPSSSLEDIRNLMFVIPEVLRVFLMLNYTEKPPKKPISKVERFGR